MLSRVDVAKALAVMQRFEPLLVVDDIAVGAWFTVLVDVVPDAEVLRAGIVEWAREDKNRNVRPSTLLPYVEQIVEGRKYAAEQELEQEQMKALCVEILKERGLTAADYNADEALRADVGAEAWRRRYQERFEIEQGFG